MKLRWMTMLLLGTAGTLFAADALPLQLSCNGSWKADESGKQFTRTVKEGVVEWSQVLAKAELEAQRYYRFSWRMTSSEEGAPDPLVLVVNGPGKVRLSRYTTFASSPEIQQFHLYTDTYPGLYTFSLRSGMKTAQTLTCGELKLEKLSSADLEQELFSSSATDFFHPLKSGWRKALSAGDDSSPTGKSISFSLPEVSSLRSGYLPIIPGKTYRMELWVKGSDVLGAKIRMDTYMGPLEGKHCYRDVNVSVTKNWKKISAEWSVPADTAVSPMLRSGMLRLDMKFNSPAATVSVAGVSLKMVKE